MRYALILTALISSTSFAYLGDGNGIWVGGGSGLIAQRIHFEPEVNDSKYSQTNLAFPLRLNVGYQFSKYHSAEISPSYVFATTINKPTGGSDKLSSVNIDLSYMFNLPFRRWGTFARVGVAYNWLLGSDIVKSKANFL